MLAYKACLEYEDFSAQSTSQGYFERGEEEEGTLGMTTAL